jgi:hypothetical protein
MKKNQIVNKIRFFMIKLSILIVRIINKKNTTLSEQLKNTTLSEQLKNTTLSEQLKNSREKL